MNRTPAWLKCKECLWWAIDTADPYWGECRYLKEELYINADHRCPNWTCRRCLDHWDRRLMVEYDTKTLSPTYQPVNHFYCPIQGRKKPEVK